MTDDPTGQFLADMVDGLKRDQKHIHCKYLYDERGSELFDAICRTPEYYVTRADLALHEAHLPEIAHHIGPQAHIIEFGSGSGVKTRKLLASLESPRAYTPIEISASALEAATGQLQAEFPDLRIHPLQADYTQPIDAEALRLDPPARRRIVYFPGSTISNFEHEEAVEFLRRMGRIAGAEGAILIGVDLLKSPERLIAAYDDDQGITAEFNRNLLFRMRDELGALINPEDFEHEARFNAEFGRIEMHLKAIRETVIEIDGHRFEFRPGETIHTENSHKYSIEGFRDLAREAGLESAKCWTDPQGLFSMHWVVGEQV